MGAAVVGSVPAWLQGAWRRRGRTLAAGGHEEVSDVLWLQVGSYFADVRCPFRLPTSGGGPSPLDAAQAFSGSVSVDGVTVTWRHDLDSLGRPTGYLDRAEVEPVGSTMMERGPGYAEVWERQAGSEPALVLERRHAATGQVASRVVSVGDLAVAVWGGALLGGAALRHRTGCSVLESRVGQGRVPWTAVDAARTGHDSPGWSRVA